MWSKLAEDKDVRKTLNVLGTVLLVALVLPFVIYAVPQVVGASHSYVVLSDSMSPSIHAGDVVIVDSVSPSEISEGDVITFQRTGGDKSTEQTDKITHRVVEVVERDGERRFRTKGDANEEPDARLVSPENVVGRVMLHIPLIGYVLTFGSTKVRLLALVVVPSALLIVNEMWTLYAAARGNDGEETTVPDEEVDDEETSEQENGSDETPARVNAK